jgi:formate hydrogenlyase subunit 3/multisubunit Na+/H+ antiporter MnhD subunit
MLLLLGIIFAGMSRTMLAMAHGESPTKHPEEPFLAVAPPVVLAVLVLLLGLFIPPPLETTLRLAARALGVPS